MKKLLFILSLLWFQSATSQRATVLLRGIMPGFRPASNTAYIAATPVTLTSGLIMDSVVNTTFDGTKILGTKYGFVYSGTGTIVSTTKGGNINDSLKGFDFGTKATYIFDGNVKPAVAYYGAKGSALYYGLYVSDSRWGGRTAAYNGTWDAPALYHNVNIGMTWERNTVANDSTGTAIQIFGTSIYQLIINDWNITGPTTSGGDCGVFYIIGGNGHVTNCYRNSGWGYLGRFWPVALGGIPGNQDIYFQNNIDAYTNHYGTLDIQMHPDLLNSKAVIPLLGCDGYFINNTSAHKQHDSNYVSNAVILGSLRDETGKIWTFHLKNSLAYDAKVSAMSQNSSLLKNNSGGFTILDSSNNYDVPPGVSLPSGLIVDQINFQPVPGGMLDRKGIGAQIIVPVCPTIHDTVIIHDTIPKVCPMCFPTTCDTATIWALKTCPTCPPSVVCPIVDTAAIQALKICPVCPTQRSLSTLTIRNDGTALAMYDDGTFTIITLKTSILIQ